MKPVTASFLKEGRLKVPKSWGEGYLLAQHPPPSQQIDDTKRSGRCVVALELVGGGLIGGTIYAEMPKAAPACEKRGRGAMAGAVALGYVLWVGKEGVGVLGVRLGDQLRVEIARGGGNEGGDQTAWELELRPRLQVRVVSGAGRPSARAAPRAASANGLVGLTRGNSVRGKELPWDRAPDRLPISSQLRQMGSHPLPAPPREVRIDTGMLKDAGAAGSAAATLVREATVMAAAPRPPLSAAAPAVATVAAVCGTAWSRDP